MSLAESAHGLEALDVHALKSLGVYVLEIPTACQFQRLCIFDVCQFQRWTFCVCALGSLLGFGG